MLGEENIHSHGVRCWLSHAFTAFSYFNTCDILPPFSWAPRIGRDHHHLVRLQGQFYMLETYSSWMLEMTPFRRKRAYFRAKSWTILKIAALTQRFNAQDPEWPQRKFTCALHFTGIAHGSHRATRCRGLFGRSARDPPVLKRRQSNILHRHLQSHLKGYWLRGLHLARIRKGAQMRLFEEIWVI